MTHRCPIRPRIAVYPCYSIKPLRPAVCSIIDDSCSEDIGKLFNNESYSDLVLNVNGTKFFAHKTILAVRSEYFQMMFSIDMSESSDKEIPIVESNVGLFEKLLRYIYTGQLELKEPILDEAIEMLTMANKYLFTKLQRSIERELESILTMENFFTIYSAAISCSAENLILKCSKLADSMPDAILRNGEFSFLPADAVKELITRKSFDPYQLEVFTAVSKWISTNGGMDKCSEAAKVLLSKIQLQSLSINFLMEYVCPSGLFPDPRILDALFESYGV